MEDHAAAAYYKDPASHRVQSCGLLLIIDRESYKVDACSSGTHSKLLDGEGSVLGRNVEELLHGVACIKASDQVEMAAFTEMESPSVFPVTTVVGNVTYCASMVAQGSKLILDLREQPATDGISTLGGSLWDAIESIFAANDVPSLLQLAATTMRRMTRYERCAIYTVGKHGKAIAAAAGMQPTDGASHVMKCVAESNAESVKDATHPILRSRHLMRRLCVCGPSIAFKEEDLEACVEELHVGEDASQVVDLSRSTLFAASSSERAAYVERGLKQVSIFPLKNTVGECWGVMVAYNYTETSRFSITDLNSCESVCRTLCSKVDMFIELKQQARKSKLLNIHGDLLDEMQKLQGFDVLKGLVANASVSLLNVVPDTQGAAVVLPSGEVASIKLTPSPSLVRELVETLFPANPVLSRTRTPSIEEAQEKEPVPYRDVADICAYLKIADTSVDAKAALVLSIGENAFLIWFRSTPDLSGGADVGDESENSDSDAVWSKKDLQYAQDLARFVADVTAWATGKNLSNEVLVRVHEQRLKSRDDCFSMALELTSILASANAPIFSVDKNKRIVLWNDEMQRLTSISKASACGMLISSFVPPKDDATLSKIVSLLATSQKTGAPVLNNDPFEINFFCDCDNGSGRFDEKSNKKVVDLLLNATHFSKSTQSASTVTFVGQDVTEAKQVLHHCQMVANEHEKLISQSGIPVFFVDTQGHVNEWNETMAEITGISKRQVMGLSIGNQVFGALIVLNNQKETKQALAAQHQTVILGKDAPYVELSFVHSSNKRPVNLFLCAGARRSDAGVSGVVYFAQDVTLRQLAERAKQEKVNEEAANKAKLEQLQFLCHEIRNPLNGILGNISFMQDTEIDEEQALLVEGTYDRAKQLREVVDDVLDISKINMNAVELEQLSFHVPSLIDTMINYPTDMDRWGSIEYKSNCTYPNVLGDPFRIQQILKKFISFCSNCPADQDANTIHVSVDCQEPLLKLGKRVSNFAFHVSSDTLVVPRTEIENMFGDVTLGEMGILRMTVCKKLAQLLGGDVWCQSSQSSGTRFMLNIDLVINDGADNTVEHLQCHLGPPTLTSRPARKQVDAGSNKMDKLEKYLDMRDRSASASPVRDAVADNPEHKHRRSKRSSIMAESNPVGGTEIATHGPGITSAPAQPAVPHQRSMRMRRLAQRDSDSERHARALAEDEDHAPEPPINSATSGVTSGGSGRSIGFSAVTRNKSDLEIELDHCRLPDREYQFEVVREIFASDYVAVLGSLMIKGVTRQAWGCASLKAHAPNALAKASHSALVKAAQTFGVHSRSSRESAALLSSLPMPTQPGLSGGIAEVRQPSSGGVISVVSVQDVFAAEQAGGASEQSGSPRAQEWRLRSDPKGEWPEPKGMGRRRSTGAANKVSSSVLRRGSDTSLETLSSDTDGKEHDLDVLIVDDESINTKIVSSALKRHGYRCTSLSDGTEVVEAVVTQGKKFDIILMDSMMKIMDGPDAVAAIRQHEWNTQTLHTPVLAVTASILKPDQEQCMRMGYQGVIAKPIAVKAFASQVDTFLDIWFDSAESKIVRSPEQWRSDPFSSLFRNNMAWFHRPHLRVAKEKDATPSAT